MFGSSLKTNLLFKRRKMSSKDVLKLIKDKQVEFVDLRFTDPKGKLASNNGRNSS